MPLSRYLLTCLLVVTPACRRAPESYAPPPQRPALDAADPEPVLGRFFRMSDPDVDQYLVKDVSRASLGTPWRWTFRRPELRFRLESIDGLRFTMDFAVPPKTFRETGPVTLAVFINGKPFHTIRCIKPDQLHFEEPVPKSFLKEGAVNFVAIEPDKVWVSKEDGVALGFVLTSAGFVR